MNEQYPILEPTPATIKFPGNPELSFVLHRGGRYAMPGAAELEIQQTDADFIPQPRAEQPAEAAESIEIPAPAEAPTQGRHRRVETQIGRAAVAKPDRQSSTPASAPVAERRPLTSKRKLMRWLGSLGAGAAIMLTYTHVENTLDRRHLEERITAETRLPDTAPPSLRVWADLVRDTALDPRVAVAVPGNKPGDEKIYKNYMVNSERRDGRSFVKMPEALMAMTSAGNPEFDDHYKHHGLMAMSDELSDQLTEEINQAKLGEPLATADKSPDANALRAMHLINKTIAKTMAQAALTERSSHPTDAQLNKAVLAAFHIPSGVVEQYFTAFNNAAANPDILKSTESFRKFFLKLAPEPKKGQNPTVYATRYADAAKVIGDPNKPYKNVANSKLMGGQN